MLEVLWYWFPPNKKQVIQKEYMLQICQVFVLVAERGTSRWIYQNVGLESGCGPVLPRAAKVQTIVNFPVCHTWM